MNQQAHTAIAVLDEMIQEHKEVLKNEGMCDYDIDNTIRSNILNQAKSRIQALGDGWNKFSEKSPNNGMTIIVHCNEVYEIAEVDDGCLVMDNESDYEWTAWKLLIPPNNN